MAPAEPSRRERMLAMLRELQSPTSSRSIRAQRDARLSAPINAYARCVEALAGRGCEWAVECGRREEMRGEPPDPCATCDALRAVEDALLGEVE